MDDLKPCPFCGSNDLTICYNVLRTYTCVNCYKCGAEGGGCETKEEAIEAWNERVGDTHG